MTFEKTSLEGVSEGIVQIDEEEKKANLDPGARCNQQ